MQDNVLTAFIIEIPMNQTAFDILKGIIRRLGNPHVFPQRETGDTSDGSPIALGKIRFSGQD
jgi:hypothetical protein